MFQQLAAHVDHYLLNCQFGFHKGDSTMFQLVQIVHRLSQEIEKGNYIFSCFCDLTKGCDKVWHQALLSNLEHLGL